MTGTASASDVSVEALVGQVADEFVQRVNRGEQPDIEEYARRHPEIDSVLRQVLAALQLVRLPAQDSAGTGLAVLPEAPVRGCVGDFRILREVGRGGMGVVYEAEQISLNRRVALKVLPFAAALNPKQLQRFKYEAQAAAQLHHRHIVPVYGVGCERGVHYYAMQYIEGQTLGAAIRELQLADPASGGRQPPVLADNKTPSCSLQQGANAPRSPEAPTPPVAAFSTERSITSPAFFRTAARLGVQAAEALEHAHQMGVVHRDIKPANLLVETDSPLSPRGRGPGGEGPFSPLSPRGTGVGDKGLRLWITDFGLARIHDQAGLTLSGDLLGTLRYMSPEQALAKHGLVDHRTDIYALGATLYALLTFQPACPGEERQHVLRQIEREDPRPSRSLNPSIPGDLETIVLKALAKEPEVHYATAQELADDLRRFLEDKPIRARRPTPVQRARKWARRHKSVVVAGLAILLMGMVAWAVSTILILRQRDEARVQRALAQEQRELARRAVDKMYTEVAEDWLTQQAHLQEVQRRFLLEALHYYEAFAQEPGADLELRLQAGIAYRRVGEIQSRLGEPARATEAYTKAIVIQAELAAAFPAHPEYRRELAATQNSRAILLMYYGKLPEAEQALSEAVNLQEDLQVGSASSPQREHQLALTRNNLALLYRRRERFQEAEQTWGKALAVQERLVANFPEVNRYRLALANSYKNLADLLYSAGRYALAKETLLRAAALQERLADDCPGVIDYRLHLAQSYHNLANVLRDSDQYADAEPALRQAVTLFERLARELPGMPQCQEGLAKSHRNLGYLLWETDRPHVATEAFRRARALYEKLVEANRRHRLSRGISPGSWPTARSPAAPTPRAPSSWRRKRSPGLWRTRPGGTS